MGIEIGDKAPDFDLKDHHGTPVRLSDYRGKQNVLLVFYPLAFSGICQGELSAIRDELPRFTSEGTQILTISVDSSFAHRVWADQENFGFPLLSDFWPHGGLARTYGVFDADMGVAKRGTFIIDKAGVVRWKIVNAIPEARDITAYQKALATLS